MAMALGPVIHQYRTDGQVQGIGGWRTSMRTISIRPTAGGPVVENVQVLTTMSSVWSAASSLRLLTSSSTRSWMELPPLIKFEMVAKASLWGGGVPSCGLGPLRVFLFGVEAQFSTGGWNSVFVIGLLLFGCIRTGLHLFEFTHPKGLFFPERATTYVE
ncbi:hypothetical protein THAOC_12488 [Thalassiosira oceanica]|uniref:Uncharacterized protein n=1 Tax=Thalassiosira oceanica TaxID=159749 RepID=K0SZX2_THAOC|nr:hypothetical protein THAOC_12488 [Thalassiosira oceanica]|eukprot:EJK66586.1 hypothetical protein THAOC_12488 [Thalassiosira oceanica]